MTTGVDIIGEILLANSELLSKVPATSIKAGKLPDGIVLPALLVRRISKVSRQPLKREAKTRKVDRVSVTVRASSYADQTAIMALVEDICAGVTAPAIAGAERVSVIDAGTGPDLLGPGNSFEQAIDFKCHYLA